MKKYQLYIVFVLNVICINNIYSQEISTVKGSCKIKIESNMSLDEAKKLAMECARKNALADAFGTKIIQNEISRTQSITQNTDIQSKSTYNAIANTEINGEWVETIGEPTYNKFTGDNGDVFIECTIKGKVRPLKKIAINFEAYPLAKMSDIKSKTFTFNNNQDLYFYFKASKDGYLNIYLDDNTNVYQLLPYKNNNQINYPVKAEKDYYFFQKAYKNLPDDVVDELVVGTNIQVEQNSIIIMFSPQPFDKPILTNANDIETLSNKEKSEGFETPKFLSSRKFMEYQQKLLKVNESLEKMGITIIINGD
jgi:hypothetical protein